MNLKDRVAIVTGGGKGIGQEICLGLVKEGAKIVIAEIDVENSEKAKKKIIDAGSEAIIIKTKTIFVISKLSNFPIMSVGFVNIVSRF